MELLVNLTKEQEIAIVSFFLQNPHYLVIEHYEHTHSPLDNLKHYMWEELHERWHVDLLKEYHNTKSITHAMLQKWMQEEMAEHESSINK